MPSAAPRIDERLIAALARLDAVGRPIAESHRRLGVLAERLRCPRPSYEQTRVLVHMLRARKRRSRAGEVLLDIAVQKLPPQAILDLLE